MSTTRRPNRVQRAKKRRAKEAKEAASPSPAPIVDEIAIDVGLEERGVKTEPKPDGAQRPIPRQGGIECAKCKRSLPAGKFSVVKHRTETSPHVRDSVCMACRAEEKKLDLEAANLERATDRMSRTQLRELLRKDRASKKVKRFSC